MASRRRRRKSIGKVIVDVERRVRRVEKRPGAKRLKTNVVTTEKLGFRAVNTKTIQPDAVTPNEASFGATFVTDTSPDPSYIKEGTMWVSPTDGSSQVYSSDLLQFVTVADTVAQETADSKNSTYYQDNAPTGGTYQVGDMWVDTNDNDKLYTWDGAAWALTQDSASAASAAQTAYDAAIASLQPSASTIVNASNQITAVNTNGITVYSGANASSGARIVMNSAGIAGFDATSTGPGNGATFSISASTGDALFKGDIVGSDITGSTITGGTIQTNTTGTRIELSSTATNFIYFYGAGTNPGRVSVNDYAMYMESPGSSLLAGAYLTLYGDQYSLFPRGVFIDGGSDSTFTMTGTSITINQGTYGISITSSGSYTVGAAAEATARLRNVRIVTTAPTSGADSSTYDNGTIVLVREA